MTLENIKSDIIENCGSSWWCEFSWGDLNNDIKG
jgi:hypothetical protein